MSTGLPWWRKPVRMMRRDYLADFSKFVSADLDALARETKERWHVNCEWVMATPGCAPGAAQYALFDTDKFEKLPSLGDHDLLRMYLPHAQKHGVQLMPYVNMHWYSYDFAAEHPGWEQLLEDGTPYGRKHPLYGGGTTFCINSPWRDWAFEMIREVMRTGVVGCFLDGPVMFPGACYCEHCRKLFAKKAGKKRMPSFGDWADPLWKPFLEFRADSWARFMAGAQAAAKGVNPDAAIFLNGGHFNSANPTTGRDAFRMEGAQTFTGSEEFFHCRDEYASPYGTLNMARFLSAGENPSVVFTHHALSTWHYNPLPPAEMATAMAQSVAGGSNTWFAIFMPAMEAQAEEAFAGVEDMGAFLEKAEPAYTADRSAAETAVLISNRTLYYYITRHGDLCRDAGSGVEKNLVVDGGGDAATGDLKERRAVSEGVVNHELPGCLDACNFGHVPVRALWDEHLTPEKLKGVETLVLPSAACLSNKQIRAITAFVENGGGLVATFESGMYDEWGVAQPRKAWLRFLGLRDVAGAFLPSRVEDYLTVVTKKLEGIPHNALLPRPLNALKVTPTKDAEILAYFNKPVGKAYLPLRGLSDHPAVLFSRRGKGRVAYVAGTLFGAFDRYHIDSLKDLARALIQLAAGRSGLQALTNAPGSLAVEVRKAGKQTVVHLVNVTSDMKRPMGPIIPLCDVEVAIRAGKVKSATCVRSGEKLKVTQSRGRTLFVVPEVAEYEMVVLE